MKIKKIINQITIPILCIAMELGNVVPAYAAITENDSSTYEETKENVTKETEVLYTKGASYFVTIPKTISLGNDKQSPYSVKVEGDIPSDRQVYVSPIDSILSTEAFDFYMHDQNLKAPKDNVVAMVTQNKFYWNFEEVAEGHEETDNSITAKGLSSGTWKGTFDFEINMHSIASNELVLSTDGDVTMGANSTYQTNAYINGKKVNEMVEWTSDNDNILVADGLLETKASAQVGDIAEITVVAENSPSAYSLEDSSESDVLSASFNVTVIDIAFTKGETDEAISSLDIKPGESGNIRASIVPDTVEGTVKWSTTATAGLNLVPNGNLLTIKVADDMPTGSTYDVIATFGTLSKILKVNIVSDHKHNYVSEVTKEATYTEKGEKTYTCTVCNDSYTEEIPMLEDNIPATGSITVSDNVWKNFLNSITFNIFFKETQNVVIKAEDKESGVKEISYYLATEQVEDDNLSSLEWTTYGGNLTISPNEQYIVYVKITDNQNNVTYINSDGIVLDNIAPTIEGVEDGGTYEPNQTITIGDEETLKVNDKEVEIKDGSYTFDEEGEYTVSVSDKAGNETSINITIQHTHNYVDNICTECGERDPKSINYVTLRSAGTANDTQRSSIFMGNSLMTREQVEKIYFQESSNGHYLSDDNCWDVSDAQDGSILAWYTVRTESASYKYYTIYIAPKNDGDIIRMPKNSSYYFSRLGYQNGAFSLYGMSIVDFSQVTDYSYMFSSTCIHTGGANSFTFDADTSAAENMDSMFSSCNYSVTNQQGYTTKYGPNSINFSDRVKTPNLKSANNMFTYDHYVKYITNFPISIIGDRMFNNCYELGSLVVPSGIEGIGERAFNACDKLTKLVIPNSVRTIGENAFYNVPLVVLPCRFEGSTFGAKAVELSHDYTSEVIKQPTCAEKGEKTYTCNDCGYSYTQEINTLSHDTECIVKAATCTEAGSKTYTCKNCEYVYVQPIKMLNHDYKESVIKEATCEEDGESKYTCSMCGDSYTETISKLSHNYVDNICTRCGKECLYQTAPETEYKNWNYTLDDKNNTITLNYYSGNDIEVTVYANYPINEKTYTTKLKTDHGSSDTYMFRKRSAIKTIKFDNGIDTSDVINMSNMFKGCSALTSIEGLDNLNTSNVTDMSYMFDGCSKLTNIDLSGFDTKNVTTMGFMFNGCKALINVELSNFDTSSVTFMGSMFRDCSKLVNLDLSSFDTSNVFSMYYMFYCCTALSNIYVGSKWSTEQAATTYMFLNCGVSEVTYK